MNLVPCCSEEMDIPECIDIIMNFFSANCVLEHDGFRTGSVMVWAEIAVLIW